MHFPWLCQKLLLKWIDVECHNECCRLACTYRIPTYLLHRNHRSINGEVTTITELHCPYMDIDMGGWGGFERLRVVPGRSFAVCCSITRIPSSLAAAHTSTYAHTHRYPPAYHLVSHTAHRTHHTPDFDTTTARGLSEQGRAKSLSFKSISRRSTHKKHFT
jgi:hypothetical protein